MKNRVTYIVFIILLLPIFILAFFNYPSADDYSFARDTYHVYLAGGGVLAILSSVLNKVITMYNTWQGNYTGVFLMTLSPMIWGGKGYFIGSWLSLVMLIVGVSYMLRELLCHILGFDKERISYLILLINFIIIWCMPTEARVEGIFWYNSAVYYTVLQGWSYLYLGLLIRNLSANNDLYSDSSKLKRVAMKSEETVLLKVASVRRDILNVLILSVMAFSLGGANYLTAINTALCSLLILFFEGKKLIKSRNLIPTIVFFAGFIISIIAPGNALRQSGISGLSPIKSIMVSYYYVFDIAIDDWTNWIIVVLLIVSVFIWYRASDKVRMSYKHPLIILFVILSLNAAIITPPLYATGNISAGRIQATFWIQYVLCIELAIGYATSFIRKFVVRGFSIDSNIGARLKAFSISFVIIILFGILLCIGVQRDYFTGTESIGELLSGEAYSYSIENIERLEVLEDTEIKDAVILPHTSSPKLLFHSDITTDVSDWTNEAMAKYYNKTSVILSDE